jgi:hypothetical protein
MYVNIYVQEFLGKKDVCIYILYLTMHVLCYNHINMHLELRILLLKLKLDDFSKTIQKSRIFFLFFTKNVKYVAFIRFFFLCLHLKSWSIL